MNLNDSIESIKGIGIKKADILRKNGIETVEDMLFHLPTRYEDRREMTLIKELEVGRICLVEGIVIRKKYRGYVKKGLTPLIITIQDSSGVMDIIFFNGRYVNNTVKEGGSYVFYGTVSEGKSGMQMVHPEIVKKDSPSDIRGIIPVYKTPKNISLNDMRKWQREISPISEEVREYLPQEILGKFNLCEEKYAIHNIHFPKSDNAYKEAKFRLIFDELFTLELGMMYIKGANRLYSEGISIDCRSQHEFLKSLPFELTDGQKKAWDDIIADMERSTPMNRLIQGDVGSGKTVIAQLAMFCASREGYQAAIMAPTELLAKQHFKSFYDIFNSFGIKVGFLSGSMKAKEKNEVLSQLASGEIKILIGTHAIIQKGVEFNNLGLVITDEQHRFGVKQRRILTDKGENPNVLVMTATPIPRTLAVVLYGDMDISQIKSLPKGRKPIKTYAGNNLNRDKIYDYVERLLEEGTQAYVVTPLIEDSEQIEARSAQEVYEELKNRFKSHKVALIHGAMSQSEKDDIMEAFSNNEIAVLVSTVVIEVGINVPNANVMIVENAERFGLAQLHQLRGRVGRGEKQSCCILISGNDNSTSKSRIDIMCRNSSGFDIAEEDLKLRGPGEIFGTKQHGIPQLNVSDLVKNMDVLNIAKDVATDILGRDPLLKNRENAILINRLEKMFGKNIRLSL